MGWLFKSGSTLKSLIEERRGDWERTTDSGVLVTTRCLACCYRGGRFAGVLWTVWERTFSKETEETQPVERWIACDLLRYQTDGWGYKDMEESMGPFYYSCPLKYLKLVPIERFGGHVEWRKGVYSYHARQKEKRKCRAIIV